MTIGGWLQIILFCIAVLALVNPLGGYMTRVFRGQSTPMRRVIRPVELRIHRLAGIDEAAEQDWVAYALSLLLFNMVGFVVLYALLRLDMPAMAPSRAFNTATSFTTNTNWQSYVGETAVGHLTAMVGLTVQNFVSAATGGAVALALIRGFVRQSERGIGNFWVDLTRIVLYLLLPLAVIGALVLVWQGVPQTLGGPVTVTTLEGTAQTIAMGPVASQEAIKMLGTNGGGFFGANSAHPYENPTPLANFVEMVMVFALGAAFTNVFGRMVGDRRQGMTLLGAMGALFAIGAVLSYWAEAQTTSALAAAGIGGDAGNMEGKDVRFGIGGSTLFATVTTAAAAGAVNSMHESFSSLGALALLGNMMTGEVVIGGVGSGLYGILLFALLAVFVAGLMVGRTPEYLGKKIGTREIKMATLALLATPFATLLFSALAAEVAGPGGDPHSFTELLYNYTSAGANNGSAFAGFRADSPFHDVTLAAAMFIGRFMTIVPLLAVAGSLASKRTVPPSPGTLPTHGPLFAGLLVGVIVVFGGLTFFPAMVLGPMAGHLTAHAGLPF